MIIDNETKKGELLIKLEGRLDTNKALELEKEIKLDKIKKIIFDLEKLEYISSSGLRIILHCKKNVNNTKIINCSNEVYEIFNMTGFSNMMDISKIEKKNNEK